MAADIVPARSDAPPAPRGPGLGMVLLVAAGLGAAYYAYRWSEAKGPRSRLDFYSGYLDGHRVEIAVPKRKRRKKRSR